MCKLLVPPLLVALLAGGPARAADAKEPAKGDKIALRVLYAGVPKDERTTEFVAFLNKHFTKVGEASYSDFKPEMADGYDVVIFDAEAKPVPGRIGLPRSPQLPPDYNRATVLVGGAGVMAVRPLNLKIDWL